MTDYAKLRELAEWATPGKWFPETYSDGHRQVCGDHRFVDDDEETYTTIADVHNRSDQEYLVAANPLTIIALIDENDSLRKRLSEALLDAERAREERNREHVRLNAEWMAKCEELRKERDHYQMAAEAEAKFADEFREKAEELADKMRMDIMNIPCKEPEHFEDAAVRMAYRVGHRDARHAAFDIVGSVVAKKEGA